MLKRKSDKNRQTIKKILRYVRPYAPQLLSVILLSVISVVFTLYIPILAGRAIDSIVGAGNVDFGRIERIFFKMIIIIGGAGIINWLLSTVTNKIVFGIVKDLRISAFRHIQKLPLSVTDTHPHGDTVSRIISDADTFADGVLPGFTQFFTGIVTIIATVVYMLMINIGVAAVVIVLTPLSLVVSRFIASRTYSMFTLQSQTRGEQTSLIQETVLGQKVVQAYSHGALTVDDFDEINDRLEKHSLKATFFSSLVNPSTRCVNNIVYALVALTGSLFVIRGSLTVGGLSCLLNYANQYTKPFNEISGVLAELQNAIACAERIFELIDEKPQSDDAAESLEPENVSGSVSAHNVSFSYTPEKPLITDFNLDVKPGVRVAIVGPTGCGKTTFINLLMRFYDVTGGKICIDGKDINSLTRQSVRRSFGMVLQDTWIRTGTVSENIAISNPGATREQIVEAAKKAHAHGFIRRLPNGYDTHLDGGASALSQGERQLLCIARLMLCHPPMLILDEATSSIDTRTEVKIQSAFAELMRGRTSFVVAHRLSTIKNSDMILVMKDGNIIEQGTHESLMEQGGFYKTLYNSQFTN